MKILVCGGRNFNNVPLLWATMDNLDRQQFIRVVIDGAARGADYLAHEWALARGKTTERYFANWDAEGKAAGSIRNKRMLDEGKPDYVIAFPGGAGTANMVNIARKAGVPVIIIQ